MISPFVDIEFIPPVPAVCNIPPFILVDSIVIALLYCPLLLSVIIPISELTFKLPVFVLVIISFVEITEYLLFVLIVYEDEVQL